MGAPCLEIHVFSFSRNSGKTLLVERIVSSISSNGIPVMAVKHVHHGGPDLVTGKDAERVFSAGAHVSVAYGSEYSLIIARTSASPRHIIELLSNTINGMFAVVFEGFRGHYMGVPVLVLKEPGDLGRVDCRRLEEAGGIVTSFNNALVGYKAGCLVEEPAKVVERLTGLAREKCGCPCPLV